MSKEKESLNTINQQVFELLETAKKEEWDDQTIADNLASLDCAIDDKLMAYRRYMDKLETAANLAEAEKKVYADQAKPYADRAKTLKSERSKMTYPILNLFKILIEKGALAPDKRGSVSMKGAYGTFFLKKNPDKLEVDETKCPKTHMRREVRFVPDLEHIEADLAEGKELDFARYVAQPDQVVLRK